MAEIKPDIETIANIKVIGVGGSGGHAVNRMVAAKIKGVEFLAVNTDIQDLHQCHASHRLHIGKNVTRGLGAGMDPSVGRAAAEESINELRDLLRGSDMVFITCGLGGGTGSGASPTVAAVAKELGALTVAVVTKPFGFEGAQRREIAERAHAELRDKVDAIITIPNDRLLQVVDKKVSLLKAFETCDEILRQGVQGIADLITVPGLINLDFADVKAIMSDAGSALMGIGRATGDNRAIEAAKAAVTSPLLELSIEGAKGILFSVAGPKDVTMHEVNEAAKIITHQADPNAKVIFGTVVDDSRKDEVVITVIATGFGERVKPSEEAGDASYRPTAFIRRDRVPDASRVSAASTPLETTSGDTDAPASGPTKPAETKSPEEEELDIPAFIRRRIRK